ncbi:MAG: hypothetical protein PGN25_20645 [Methylorubrum populi]
MLDIAADSLTDALFGKRGTSGGMLAGLLGGGTATAEAAGPATGIAGMMTSLNSFLGFADGGIVGLSGPPGAVCGTAQGCGELPA